MAHTTFSNAVYYHNNDNDNDTFSVVTISYTYNDTTLPSGPLSVSPEEAAGLSASFRSASWSPTSAYGQGLGFTPYFQSSGSPGRFPADGETLAILEGCREAFRKFEPWNNPQNVISARTTELLESVVYCGVLPLLCVLGLFTNFLSCAVFYRLGVKRGINLCLFLLSLSDQLFLLSKTSAKTSKVILELAYTTEEASRWNYAMATYHLIRKPVIFISFSNFLTMLASLDRCASIVSPLKARLIFTHKIIVTAIITAFVVSAGWNVFIGFRFKPQCVYNSREKTTVWYIGASVLYNNYKDIFNTVDSALVFVFPFISILVVILSSCVIIYQLKKASSWRQTSVSGDTGSGSRKSAETQLNKMLIVVSIIHVVSTLPSISKDIVKLVFPEFNVFGRYGNLFVASIAMKDAAAAINCSVNCFVYHTLSSQFRHTLSAMLGTRSANASISTSITNTATTSIVPVNSDA